MMIILQLIVIFFIKEETLTQSFPLIMKELFPLKEIIMVSERNTLSSLLLKINLGLLH